MTRFKGILLDLDDTVYDYEDCNRKALQKTLAYVANTGAFDYSDVAQTFSLARRQVKSILSGTAASHNRLLYFQRTSELLAIGDLSVALSAYEMFWDEFLKRMTPRESFMDVLDVVSDKSICLITDLTAHIQLKKIVRLNLQRSVHHLVTSEEAGCEKPHPFIFLLALHKMKMNPNECVMIGDDFEKDIMGAAQLGIKSFWMNFKGTDRETPKGSSDCRSFEDVLCQIM